MPKLRVAETSPQMPENVSRQTLTKPAHHETSLETIAVDSQHFVAVLVDHIHGDLAAQGRIEGAAHGRAQVHSSTSALGRDATSRRMLAKTLPNHSQSSALNRRFVAFSLTARLVLSLTPFGKPPLGIFPVAGRLELKQPLVFQRLVRADLFHTGPPAAERIHACRVPCHA